MKLYNISNPSKVKFFIPAIIKHKPLTAETALYPFNFRLHVNEYRLSILQNRHVREVPMKFIDRLRMHEGRAVVITGAGVSTPSGIPDFRSEDGIYSKYDPMKLFGLENFIKDPAHFYWFAVKNIFTMADAAPNTVHRMLARLEEIGLIKGIVTQNIDGLHSKAGSKKVAEVHGNVSIGYCTWCFREYKLKEIVSKNKRAHDGVPRCECGGVIKPNIVFFGEGLPEKELEKAYGMIEGSTLIAAMGTSLTVYPVAAFPYEVLRTGGELIIANGGKTGLDSLAVERYEGPLEKLSSEIMKDLNFLEGL